MAFKYKGPRSLPKSGRKAKPGSPARLKAAMKMATQHGVKRALIERGAGGTMGERGILRGGGKKKNGKNKR